MTKIFKKLAKIVKISIKLSVFSDRLSERSHGWGGGGEGGRGATVGWGQQRGRGQ